MTVETSNGLMYSLRFGEVSSGDTKSGAPSDDRNLFVMVHFDAAKAAAYGGDAGAGERTARASVGTMMACEWWLRSAEADFQNFPAEGGRLRHGARLRAGTHAIRESAGWAGGAPLLNLLGTKSGNLP